MRVIQYVKQLACSKKEFLLCIVVEENISRTTHEL